MSSLAEHSQIQRKDGKFKAYKPYSRGNAARITDEQWEPFFPLIRCLHNARRTRVQIIDVLREHGLEPSVAQLYAKMSKWGLKGYAQVQAEDVQHNDLTSCYARHEAAPIQQPNQVVSAQADDGAEDSSGDSQKSDSTDCFSHNEVDSSDTVYETEGPPVHDDCEDTIMIIEPEEATVEEPEIQPPDLTELVEVDARSMTMDSTDTCSVQSEIAQRLPTDLMAFVQATGDIQDFDKHDILNEVASFLCATSSFSDAFVLFDASYTYLKETQGPPMALVFATINCLRSATFREQCQYAGALMGEALGSLRRLSYTNPYAATAFASLEEIGRELCVKSELEYLNILYTQMRFNETSFSGCGPSRTNTNEVLLHCSDPFLLARSDHQSELLTQTIEVSGISLGRVVGKLSRWCCSAIDDFNPIAMLPSAGFNPSDPISGARFATALSCHFVRKWSFLSLPEVLANCNELLPPNRKDAAARLCKLAVRVLSTLAVYTIFQATGTTLRSVADDYILVPENQAQYISPLASHLDVLSRMRNRDRVLVFAEMHKTLYNRTLVYRQQMDDHCLIAHVRETGFLLAASLIRLKRELNSEVPRPARDISRPQSPVRDCHSPSRKSSDSSSSMRHLARRNLLVPGIMSKNGGHLRSSWTRRLSTDSNESWNFTRVTGLPSGPTPPESERDHMQCDNENPNNNDNEEMTDMNMF